MKKKKTIILLIIAVLIIGAGAAAYWFFIGGVSEGTDKQQSTQSEASKPASDTDSFTLDKTTMAAIEDISLDYAIMEKAPNVVSVNASFDWDDVGSWDAMAKHFPEDEHGNAAQGKAIFGIVCGLFLLIQ